MNNYEDKNNLDNQPEGEAAHRSRTKKKQGSKTGKKYKMNWKQFAKFILCLCLAVGLVGVIYAAVIIIKAPDINTDDIYSQLTQSSVLYDDDGNIIDTVYGANGQNRTIVEISQIPKDLQHAFIALEDKTFETHHGFNIIRIFGAIKDALLSGGQISGTSTITQQLARNLYLPDEMFDHSLSRKITEAYYAVIMEKKLNKDQILEAYLNTINFGSGHGVQAASQAYFSKDVEELTIAECAALAAMPQAPTTYALVKAVSIEEVDKDADNVIKKSGDTAYIWNDTAKGRIQTCLALMLEQGYINQAQYDEAMAVEIKDMVNPNTDALNAVSDYFADYVIKTVIADLQEEFGYDYAKASDMVYNGGLKIYTTLNTQAQEIVEKEFKKNSNFPSVVANKKDKNGNILDDFGNVLLYQYSNYIEEDHAFKLKSSEFQWNDDGSLTIFAGKRLNIYDTTVNGATDYSVEFKNMYVVDDGKFYGINGGYINIPQQYKSKDSSGNLVVSTQFFTDYPEFFVKEGKKLSTKEYTLNQRVIQPQSAMTIIENETGYVKAMIGGRKTTGRMLFNRATATRQPGSSIKPLAVYSAALQKSFELAAAGETYEIQKGFGRQKDSLWGNYVTAGTVLDDEPTKINGKMWPTNSGGTLDGLITVRRALQKSLNICAVKILNQVGTDFSMDLVKKYGITSLVDEGDVNDNNLAAMALGGLSKGVSTLEMASAYSTFVNDGVHKSYSVYTKVTTRNDETLLEASPTETEVLDKGVAWIARDMLQSVVTNGLGAPAAVSGARAGGKTGTTSDQFDIWFDGFTAKYSASLWIGNDVNIKLSSMSGTAASLWGKIMNQIDDVASGTYSSRPDNVIRVAIDTKSGMLATDASGNDVYNEYFTEGTQPTEPDTLHQFAVICQDSGYLATPSCTDTTTKLGIMRPYVPNPRVPDAKKELPHYYCNLHNPDPNVYPVEEGKDVTIVQPPAVDPTDTDVPTPTDPENPGDTEGGEGDGDSQNPDSSSTNKGNNQ